MSNTPKTVDFNKGRACSVAFIFSCPGEREQRSGLLVNGQTGNNLDMLIAILRNCDAVNKYFPYVSRYDYRITNSSNIIHYKALDGRSEPSISEIKAQANIDRLLSETSGYELIIGFGDKAKIALECIKKARPDSILIPVSHHLGFMSINRINFDSSGNKIPPAQTQEDGKKNTLKRLTVIANELIDKITAK